MSYDENQPSYYSIIPATIRYDERLKYSERLLYGEITALIGKNGYCFASNSYFSKLYGVIPGTISRWISHLDKLDYIKVQLMRNNKKEIIERRIYITDISCRQFLQNTYEQNSTYPYKQLCSKSISKIAKGNNINIMMDRLFDYIINKEGKIPREFDSVEEFNEFYEIIKRFEFNYTKDNLKTFKMENIQKVKTIMFCLKEIFIRNERTFLLRITRDELINIYDSCKNFELLYKGTDKEIINFYDYYYASVIKKIKAKCK